MPLSTLLKTVPKDPAFPPQTSSHGLASVTRFEPATRTIPSAHAGWATRIGWAARGLSSMGSGDVTTFRVEPARAELLCGDVVIARVIRPGKHRALVTADNRRLRLYRDDEIVGVVGARYASDAFESGIVAGGSIHLVTASGMCSTVRERHSGCSEPTELRLLGSLADHAGPMNTVDRLFRHRQPVGRSPVVLMVGSGMNAGKTTTSRRLVKALLRAGKRVAACKLTGSVSHRDLYEYQATSANDVRDFSDYGFPSTYGATQATLEDLFRTMVADAELAAPDVIVMEVADGVLQPETCSVLESQRIGGLVGGVILSAPCALSSLEATRRVVASGHRVLAVSGIINNAPLMVREFAYHCDIPVLPSTGQAVDLAAHVIDALQV